MKKNSLWKKDGTILRILEIQEKQVLVIDCVKRAMPGWIPKEDLRDYAACTEEQLWELTGIMPRRMEELEAAERKFSHEHFTMIAGILPFVSNEKERSRMLSVLSASYQVSKQTIRSYLCLYLAYQDMSVFAPKAKKREKELSPDEKNMRWALNKFYYTKNQNSLSNAYTMMLKHKYCDPSGSLLPDHPSMHQFRYFYRKHKDLRGLLISRDGKSAYQRNNRPLLGDGVQEFAPAVGVGMLDATVCDIYLVNGAGELVGRPILTACVDAYSSLCCGYALSWEGGTYSLRGLMLNVLADKQEHCRKHGIKIDKAQWDCDKLPATLVTDLGSEYISDTFGQIAELGVTLIHLPAYRPELKGPVEKFFDLIQESYKPYLKGKGVIEPDYQERGSHDYRKDACLTLEDFEKIILRCILYYNTKRILENFPYTEGMLSSGIHPHASDVWNYSITQPEAHLIPVTEEQLILTLLPRTSGKFTKFGLKANRLRYKNENFVERFLQGGTVTVAYNPEDVSFIWLVENGSYIRFTLIESRFERKTLAEVQEIQEGHRQLVKDAAEDNLQAKIELADHIEAIAASHNGGRTKVRNIRDKRRKEQDRTHKDYLKGGIKNA